MKIIEKKNATGSLAVYSADVAREPVVVTSNGKPIAALVSIKNVDLETFSLSTNPEFLNIIEHSRSRLQVEGSISGKEMRNRLGIDHEN